jgi:cytochrome c-type protein NapB
MSAEPRRPIRAWGALALAAVACTGVRRVEPIPGTRLGLVQGSLWESPSPDPVADNTSAPGERPALPRAHPGAPPVIPHGIADLPPITRDENFCLTCHLVDDKVEGGPTPVPRSHFVDLRGTPGDLRTEVAGARYACTSCHVPQTDAPALVANPASSR